MWPDRAVRVPLIRLLTLVLVVLVWGLVARVQVREVPEAQLAGGSVRAQVLLAAQQVRARAVAQWVLRQVFRLD